MEHPGSGFGNSDSGFRRGHVCGNQLYLAAQLRREQQKGYSNATVPCAIVAATFLAGACMSHETSGLAI